MTNCFSILLNGDTIIGLVKEWWDNQMQIGARIIKTGIAVTITMFICKTFQLEPAVFGAVSAVINMQPSIFLSFKTLRDQFLVHLLAVTIAIALGYLVGGNPLSMGFITILIILLYRQIQMQNGIATGVVAAVFILSSSPDEFLLHAWMRTEVIFIGLFTAMLINVLFWPPRHQQKFREKLYECNQAVVQYFCNALQIYAMVDRLEPHVDTEEKERVHQLNNELRLLLNFSQNEGKSFFSSASEQAEWFGFAEKFIDYNESLIEKADRIYDLVPVRYERRSANNYPPLTPEFQNILELLVSRCATINRINLKLRTAVINGKAVETEEISEAYWGVLVKAIEEWQAISSNHYYFHSLIEIAVMANEIKAASRQGKKLLMEINKGVNGF